MTSLPLPLKSIVRVLDEVPLLVFPDPPVSSAPPELLEPPEVLAAAEPLVAVELTDPTVVLAVLWAPFVVLGVVSVGLESGDEALNRPMVGGSEAVTPVGGSTLLSSPAIDAGVEMAAVTVSAVALPVPCVNT